MNQYVGTAPSTFQVLYRDLFFFAVCTLFQLALDIILGPRFATMHVTPGFAIIFQKSLKEKVKENNYWLQCLFAQNTKTPTPPILKKTFFATDASLTPKFTPSGGPLQRQSEHQRCPPKHPLHHPVLYLKNGGHFLFKEGAPTVDGRNPAPVDMDHLRLLIGFYLSQVVSRISSINRISYTKRP